ncbi:MAG: ATP-grasp domain-containing protein [Pirellulaceae bacterium]|nr:ATP-grasp domain-containing protein [Pirellulaceae bacterium]
MGYSSRALVQAVVDLGHHAISLDAFGDQDTIELATRSYVVEDWPFGILPVAGQFHVDGWLLAGGMEHLPDTVHELNRLAPVLGPSAEDLRTLRLPGFWQACTEQLEGVGWPSTQRAAPDDLTRSPDWLFKPYRSAGGLHIYQAGQEPSIHQLAAESGYWQQQIQGRSLGVNWTIGHRQTVDLLGITESLCALQWPGPSPYIYRGSLGPIALSAAQRQALTCLAERVASMLPNYCGWLQADFIEDRQGRLWLLEFNPRWTAGMEVLQQCTWPSQPSPLAQHLKTWNIEPAGERFSSPTLFPYFSKAIYYAPSDLELSQEARLSLQRLRPWQAFSNSSTDLSWSRVANGHAQWSIADIPPIGSATPMQFRAGDPILTIRSRVSLQAG